MQNVDLRSLLGNRCRDLRSSARRLVLAVTALTIFFCCGNAFASSRSRHRGPPVDERTVYPGSVDLFNEIGPLTLSSATFDASGKDAHGIERDESLSGHSLGVDKLVFDQFGASLRIGIAHGLTLGVPITFGFSPFDERSYPSSSTQNGVHATGGTAGLVGIGFSPGYEINFGDSAFRFDAQVLARAVFLPVNLSALDKHGNTVGAEAVAGEILFEPRITILPYAHKDLGLGFFAEIDAVHPENWSVGGVVQFRFGTKQ